MCIALWTHVSHVIPDHGGQPQRLSVTLLFMQALSWVLACQGQGPVDDQLPQPAAAGNDTVQHSRGIMHV